MADRPTVEPTGEHLYLVRGEQDGSPVEVRVVADPDYLDSLALEGAEEAQVVDVAVSYLLGHQRLDELPPRLYLDDVGAAYPEFEQHLRDHFAPSGG